MKVEGATQIPVLGGLPDSHQPWHIPLCGKLQLPGSACAHQGPSSKPQRYREWSLVVPATDRGRFGCHVFTSADCMLTGHGTGQCIQQPESD